MTSVVEDLYPLSPLQHGMLFHALYAPDSGLYIERLRYTLDGSLSVSAFEQAWQTVIARHPILRTGFIWEDVDEPHQIVFDQVPLPLEQLDWRHLSATEQQSQLDERFKAEQYQPFDLKTAPLMRLTLIQIAETRYEFFWSYHHLLLDGWSVPLLLSEVATRYTALSEGASIELPEVRPFRDYISWLQQQDTSEAKTFWRNALQGFTTPTALNIGLANSDMPAADEPFIKQSLHLSETLTAQLEAFARDQRLTLNTVIQGAWASLLSRYSGEQNVIFGSVVSGRPVALEGSDTMVGLLMNTIPVPVSVLPDTSISDWLQQLQNQQIEARQYEYSPLVQIQSWSDIPTGSPLFESLVVFENKAMGAKMGQQESAVEIHSSVHDGSTTGYSLTLVVEPGDTLDIDIYYDTRRFDVEAVSRLSEYLQALLEGIVSDPEQRVQDLPILTVAEQQRILVDFTATTTNYPHEATIADLFEAQAAQSPNDIALIFPQVDQDQRLTYAALNMRANQLAHYLQKQGVGPETLVGLVMERSVDMVVAVLAILKAGGAYLPLDPDYPAERLAFMLTDSQTPVLLIQSQYAAAIPSNDTKIISIDTDWNLISKESSDNPTNSAIAENLAYVMYTSGSTGQPKGTSISQRSVVRLVKQTNYATFGADEVFLLFAPISFDASTLELWGPLLNGGRLVIFPPYTPSLEDLGKILKQYQITTLWLTSGLFHVMVDERLEDLGGVKQLLSGGDVLSVNHVKQAVSTLNDCRLINGYGPTENTTFTTCFPIESLDQIGGSVPIGSPISNTQVYILDEQLQPVPIGAIGQLYIGGDGLARDYFNRPDMTAERFIPHPFSSDSGARLYKTGDLVRWLPTGAIEFLGRIDHQVKLRGFRIELSEIETVLGQHPHVQDLVVIAREDTPGDKQLVAYIVSDHAETLTTDDLRHFLKTRLPDYMVPSTFVMMDVLPLNPNGKVDRKALPKPDHSRSDAGTLAEPTTPIEEVLVNIWSQVLDVEALGIHDSFFDLGGHSLRATQIISRIREAFQVDLPLRQLFEAPTVAGLANHIEAAVQGQVIPTMEPVPRNGTLPLSFAQQRLWFIDQLEPGNPAYNIPSAVRLTGQLNAQALEDSLNEIVQRHESLRTTFDAVDGKPVQAVAPMLTVSLAVEDVSHQPEADREATVRQYAEAEAATTFDLEAGPLFRVRLLKLADNDHVVLFTLHHIISDEWSLNVLTAELATLYEAFSQNQPSPLADLPVQYPDFAHWQRNWLQGEVFDQQMQYWKQQLSGELPIIKLPFDRPHPINPTYEGAIKTFELSSEISQGLRDLSRNAGATMFMTTLAALQTLLHRYTAQDDIIVGTDIANRNRLETEGLIGFFVNHLVLRTNFSGKPEFSTLLKRVRDVTLGAYAHQDMPFDRLVSALQPDRQADHTPLFQVLFVYGNPSNETVTVPGLQISPVSSDFILAKYALTLFINEGEHGIQGAWRYRTELFDAETIDQLAAHFATLITNIVTSSDSRVHRLEMLTQAEQAQNQQAAQTRQKANSRRRRAVRRKAVELSVEA